jgi:hypothetical protein
MRKKSSVTTLGVGVGGTGAGGGGEGGGGWEKKATPNLI